MGIWDDAANAIEEIGDEAGEAADAAAEEAKRIADEARQAAETAAKAAAAAAEKAAEDARAAAEAAQAAAEAGVGSTAAQNTAQKAQDDAVEAIDAAIGALGDLATSNLVFVNGHRCDSPDQVTSFAVTEAARNETSIVIKVFDPITAAQLMPLTGDIGALRDWAMGRLNLDEVLKSEPMQTTMGRVTRVTGYGIKKPNLGSVSTHHQLMMIADALPEIKTLSTTGNLQAQLLLAALTGASSQPIPTTSRQPATHGNATGGVIQPVVGSGLVEIPTVVWILICVIGIILAVGITAFAFAVGITLIILAIKGYQSIRVELKTEPLPGPIPIATPVIVLTAERD